MSSIALITLLPAVAQPQSVQRAVVGAPLAELAEPFTSVRAVRELSDGRVLVADTEEQAIYLADFDDDGYDMVGRNGGGPGEYQMPLALLPLPGDSSLVFDPANGRYLIINPDGTPGETFRLEGIEGAFQMPSGVDDQGRLYFANSVRSGAGSGSATIYRYDRAAETADTIASMTLPEMKVARGSSGGLQIRVGNSGGMPMVIPFQARDAWAVSPDGKVAIAHTNPYQVEWYGVTDTVIGPPIPYDPLPITKADEDAQEAQAPKATIAMQGGGTRSFSMPVAQRSDWPDYKPPFRSRGILVSPQGELWLPRYREAEANEELYDLFDHRGNRVRQVQLPPDTSLAGFGDGWLYLVRVDEDGLNWLGRYPIP